MREIQMYPPKKRRPPDLVRKLQFTANGRELAAWVDQARRVSARGRTLVAVTNLYACDLASGTGQLLEDEGLGDQWGETLSDPVLSPDGRYLVTEMRLNEHHENVLSVFDRHDPGAPLVPTTSIGFSGFFFTTDGAALVAVRNGQEYEDDARDVARFELAKLTAPPTRFKEKVNPLTLQPMRVAVRNLKWKSLLARPPWLRASTAALSADGRFLAVGDVQGVVHVTDLKKKAVIATLPPEKPALRYRVAERIALDPSAKWLVRLGGGRLFARPLGEGKAWQTKHSLGYAYDFAFHPTGRILCAVFPDGQARYFDPLTGAVREAFRWGRKPLHAVAFSPDGLMCAAGGENGRVVLWDVDA